MTRKGFTAVILIMITVIITVIIVDFLSSRPDRRGSNPYEFNVDEYKKVDESLVSHRETKNFSLGSFTATGICWFDDRIYLTGDSSVIMISPEGEQMASFGIPAGSTCIMVNGNGIFIGFLHTVTRYDIEGKPGQNYENLGDRSVITSLAQKGDRLYAADAGNRRVVIYGRDGKVISEFEGKSDSKAGHGFIIPSPNFDLAVNSYGDLWVVNPGIHSLENYTDDGVMRGYWQHASLSLEGFAGCCNPAEIAVMEDGSFITSEKGLVRIKIYDESGSLKSVVAPPAAFKEDGKAPEVCVGKEGNIYALDFDRNRVRVFEQKQE